MMNFLSKWYNEGIEFDPPPCLRSETFYYICSHNRCCNFVGFMGTKWGDKYRSQIFFIGFWLSIIGMAALCASMACLSTDSSSIKSVPFFQGSFDVVENGVSSKLYYYAGIARMVIRGCDDGENCPPESLGWGDDSCDRYFSNCHKCIFKPRKVSFPIVMSLLGQVGQIATDLNRSTSKYDVHCQKFIGLLAGVLGMVGNISAISDFGSSCMGNLHTNPGIDASMSKHPGAALILLLIGTLLRVYDIWAHVIVPVHEVDFWKPDSLKQAGGKDSVTTTQPGSSADTTVVKEVAMRETVNPVWVKNEVA